MTYTGATGEVSAVHQRAGSEPSRQLGTTRPATWRPGR
jgi:hypothetical protein